ncbi:hypothetical protein JCM14124_23760 [Humidesulfovibrio idahonensis]
MSSRVLAEGILYAAIFRLLAGEVKRGGRGDIKGSASDMRHRPQNAPNSFLQKLFCTFEYSQIERNSPIAFITLSNGKDIFHNSNMAFPPSKTAAVFDVVVRVKYTYVAITDGTIIRIT